MYSEPPVRKQFTVVDVRQDLLRLMLAALANRPDESGFSREEAAVIVRFFRAENLDSSLEKHGGTQHVEEYMNKLARLQAVGESQKPYSEEWLRGLSKHPLSR